MNSSHAQEFESRLTSVTGPGISASYSYNGLDTRISKVENSVSQTFVRDGAYVTDPVLRDSTASYTPGLSSRVGSDSTFMHSGLKNMMIQTDAAGSTSASKQYDAFGNLVGSSGTWSGPFGYAGGFGYQEDATGLKLLGHRYYDSSTGRFLTRDPIKDGRNWYVYCESSPLMYVDPEGLALQLVALVAIAVVIGGLWYINHEKVDGKEEAMGNATEEFVNTVAEATPVPTEPVDGLDIIYKGIKPITSMRARTEAMYDYENGDESAGDQSDRYEQGEQVRVFDGEGNVRGIFGTR